MVLEATVLCLDNSEWMRNGDYVPSRLEAQHDAINLICGAKTQSNPENVVGVIACSGKNPQVLVTLTSDLGKVIQSLHEVKIGSNLNFLAGVQVAQLALKHRQNKNQHQRVIFFVGSPVEVETDELVRLGKRLKKNNIAVDVVNFGEEAKNTEKLEAFIAAVVNNDNSHLVTVPPGPHILSDILITSAVITGSDEVGGGGGSGGSGGASEFGFGVDPNMDPELALALRVSLEEERARQEAARKKEESENGGSSTTTDSNSNTNTSTITPSSKEVVMGEANDDDDLLAQAIAMSMQPEAQKSNTTSTSTPVSTPLTSSEKTKDAEMKDFDEDDDMALALQMSMQDSKSKQEPNKEKEKSSEKSDLNKAMEDPNFVNSVLKTLPGVDPNDERIKQVLASLGKKPEEKKDEEKKDEKK